jgi:hypothetical protein
VAEKGQKMPSRVAPESVASSSPRATEWRDLRGLPMCTAEKSSAPAPGSLATAVGRKKPLFATFQN